MGPDAISLSVRANGREGSYRFTCPSCDDDVEKRADRKIVALLVSAGVDIAHGGEGPVDESSDLFDDDLLAPAGSGAPVFTPDDVIEFHYMLEDDSYIREFLTSSGGV